MPFDIVFTRVSSPMPSARHMASALTAEIGIEIRKEIDHILRFHPTGIVHPVGQVAHERLRLRADRLAVDRDGALRLAQQARQDLDERRFAGAVRPEQADDLARRKLQVDVVERGLCP